MLKSQEKMHSQYCSVFIKQQPQQQLHMSRATQSKPMLFKGQLYQTLEVCRKAPTEPEFRPPRKGTPWLILAFPGALGRHPAELRSNLKDGGICCHMVLVTLKLHNGTDSDRAEKNCRVNPTATTRNN